ncbi:MAG TPA: hypothetical protein VGN52_16455 [Burkholderiales bacterium]
MAAKKAVKKAAAKKPAAKRAAVKKPAARRAAAKKSRQRVQDKHFLPPWVVIGKSIDAAIIGVDPQFKSYVVAYFDAPSGWVELEATQGNAKLFRRTHFNNIVIEQKGYAL